MTAHTCHEVREVTEGLAEDHVAVLRNTFLKLLLQVAATVLVLAELWDLANEVLEPRTGEPVDCSAPSSAHTKNTQRSHAHSRSISPRLCLGP